MKNGYGPSKSQRILYVAITDETYAAWGKNFLDRSKMAEINDALLDLGAKAVVYDIIFANPSTPAADQQFKDSIINSESVYLPIGMGYRNRFRRSTVLKNPLYRKYCAKYCIKPIENGHSTPFYLDRIRMQYADFLTLGKNSGHISPYLDPDGICRHLITLIKADAEYIPTLSLTIFLDAVNVAAENLIVNWGQDIIVPAIDGSLLKKPVKIPIDHQGKVFIPFAEKWETCFKKITAHDLLLKYSDEFMRGNLADEIEDNFVFIGDVSTGASDMGSTPLQENAVLTTIHTSLLNGMLTNTFYRKLKLPIIIGILFLMITVMTLSAFLKSSRFLYALGILNLLTIVSFTAFSFTGFLLVPIVSMAGSVFIVFLALIIGSYLLTNRERTFIKNAFSKYVPAKVVNQLIQSPQLLQLGGEERVVTMLFTDLENFTTISESMPVRKLVQLLNDYLTEMTDIIIQNGGVIDKYEGDAIMAEFGAPIASDDHAAMAVISALKMQKRLVELRNIWRENGLPELKCRIGINTGTVIIGNMGSRQVFDYTVIGDDVNLAARLESANKQYNTHLMISEATLAYLPADQFRMRILDVIMVKGKSKAVKVFEVVGLKTDDMKPDDLLYFETYHDAFMDYLSKNFDAAIHKFQQALAKRPNDIAAKKMIARIEALNPEKIPEVWDGSVALTSK